MSKDPHNLKDIEGGDVFIDSTVHKTIIIDGQPVEVPGFDEWLAHLQQVQNYDAYARWADRPESAPASNLLEPDEGAAFLQISAVPLPQRLSAFQTDHSGEAPPAQELISILAGVHRAVILGEPGSGKTTALERLAWVIATSSISEVEMGSGILQIPIFVYLREYGGEADLIPLLRDGLNHHGVLSLSDHSLRYLLRNRSLKFTLLLDGLNEFGRFAEEGPIAINRHLKNYPDHTVFLTCRTADFDPEYHRPESASLWQILPLEDDIKYWDDVEGHSDVREYLRQHLGERTGKQLYQRIRNDERLREAAKLPLLLYMIKEGGAEGELPSNRGELVRNYVRGEKMLKRAPKFLRGAVEKSLEEIAWAMQTELRDLKIGDDDLYQVLRQVRGDRDYSLDQVRRYLQQTGLLIKLDDRGPYRLLHQLLQEYAAAAYLTLQLDYSNRLSSCATDDWHREMCILALWLVKEKLTTGYLQELMTTPTVDLRVRVTAANIMAEIGDPRVYPPTMLKGIAVILPDLVPVPGGIAVLGGEDPEGDGDELPECEVTIQPFELARYPVTNAEYQCFIKAGGYEEPAYWPPAGQAWLRGERELGRSERLFYGALYQMLRNNPTAYLEEIRNQGTAITDEQEASLRTIATWSQDDFIDFIASELLQKKHRAPEWWDDRRFNQANQPVAGVNWYEAMAYTAWLSEISGDTYQLPTEAEWEWAARRRSPENAGRRYPWGDEWDPGRCNHSGNRLNAPSPVGIYPHGATPGENPIFDLAGNIEEWTLSLYQSYPYQPEDGRENVEAEVSRVARGGSWYLGRANIRCAHRNAIGPWYRFQSLGFRLTKISPMQA